MQTGRRSVHGGRGGVQAERVRVQVEVLHVRWEQPHVHVRGREPKGGAPGPCGRSLRF